MVTLIKWAPTRHPHLGLSHQTGYNVTDGRQVNDWRWVDISQPGREALVGPAYPTKLEALADLGTYAVAAGWGPC